MLAGGSYVDRRVRNQAGFQSDSWILAFWPCSTKPAGLVPSGTHSSAPGKNNPGPLESIPVAARPSSMESWLRAITPRLRNQLPVFPLVSAWRLVHLRLGPLCCFRMAPVSGAKIARGPASSVTNPQRSSHKPPTTAPKPKCFAAANSRATRATGEPVTSVSAVPKAAKVKF